MENETLSITDEIYQEPMDGLKTGLDQPHFLAKPKSEGETIGIVF